PASRAGAGSACRNRRPRASDRLPPPRHPRARRRVPRGCRGCRRGHRACPTSLPPLKIVCLIKQIPRPDAIAFDQDTKSLKREGVPLVLNPFDARAITEAVRLRDATGGEVIAMTMGPPQAEEALGDCLWLGADRCIHLSDRAFALADTIGTSRTLALALRKEGCDLVLCGRK